MFTVRAPWLTKDSLISVMQLNFGGQRMCLSYKRSKHDKPTEFQCVKEIEVLKCWRLCRYFELNVKITTLCLHDINFESDLSIQTDCRWLIVKRKRTYSIDWANKWTHEHCLVNYIFNKPQYIILISLLHAYNLGDR